MGLTKNTPTAWVIISAMIIISACAPSDTFPGSEIPDLDSDVMIEFQNDLKQRTFQFFWEVVDEPTWQTDDRFPTRHFTSIAATGFALPAYIIGAENGYITRDEAANRVLRTLEWLWNSPQGPDAEGMTGHRGFFYHFLNYESGTRYKNVELSTIDTSLLMAGVLTTQSYFDDDNASESRIRALADSLYMRIEWNWAREDKETVSMGWHPETGFIEAQWKGYNEAMILLILGMGSPTHPLPDNAWDVWTSTYEWSNFYGFDHVNFGPLFGHQYSHMFIDFRNIHDDYMREKGIDYFENSRRATLANRAYSIDNPTGFKGYGPNVWGLTASDGPGNESRKVNDKDVTFRTYYARGAANGYIRDDGTIAPTAAGGSIPFTPKESLSALYHMKTQFGDKLYQKYGFLDAFNLTWDSKGWFNPDYLVIDQGPIIIQLENYESGLIRDLFSRNPHIVRGLKRAGFTGGWLDEITINGTSATEINGSTKIDSITDTSDKPSVTTAQVAKIISDKGSLN
jgi:hypothetical protein